MPRPDEILYPTRPEHHADRRKEATHGKVLDEFFDHPTLLAVSRLITHGYFTSIDHPISTGKEGGVFRATTADGFVAVKVYRIGNATFRRFPPHALEELRREVSIRNFRALIPAWTRREHTILGRLRGAGVRVPTPIAYARNVLVMEYIGDAEGAAPRIKDAVIDDVEELYDDLVDQIRRMWEPGGIVHGDLSPYNLLAWKDHVVTIDVAQAVSREHPQARELLRRDIRHLAEFLTRRGRKVKAEEFLARIEPRSPGA